MEEEIQMLHTTVCVLSHCDSFDEKNTCGTDRRLSDKTWRYHKRSVDLEKSKPLLD